MRKIVLPILTILAIFFTEKSSKAELGDRLFSIDLGVKNGNKTVVTPVSFIEGIHGKIIVKPQGRSQIFVSIKSLVDAILNGGIIVGTATLFQDEKNLHIDFQNSRKHFIDLCEKQIPQFTNTWKSHPKIKPTLSPNSSPEPSPRNSIDSNFDGDFYDSISVSDFSEIDSPDVLSGSIGGFEYATVSLPKRDHVNQDRILIHDFGFPDRKILFAVFDGHGKRGHEIAEKFRSELPEEMLRSNYFGQSGKQLILLEEAISAIEGRLDGANDNCMAYRSGTTGTVGYIDGECIYVLQIGDSKLIFVNEVGFLFHSYEVRQTQSHNLKNPAEFSRIETAIENGKLGGAQILEHKRGTTRFYLPTIGKLAPTRVLGDFAFKDKKGLGINSKADFYSFYISKHHKFLVLGTDGLTEALSSEAILDAAFDNAPRRYSNNPQTRRVGLEKTAHSLIEKIGERGDDLSFILVSLE